ncbi:MAG: hypothetical protein R6U04_00820 [Bacteroidales bacterium]
MQFLIWFIYFCQQMINVNKITKLLFAYLIIGSIAFMVVNRAIFIHAHEKDGTVIFHAHPYDKANDTQPIKSHHHSDPEFIFIEHLELLFPLLFLFFALFYNEGNKKHKPELQTQYYCEFIPVYLGRAPPFA